MTLLGKVRLRRLRFAARALVLWAALAAGTRAARAQETPPPAGEAPPTVSTPGPAPGNDAPTAPPMGQPTGQPAPPSPGQPPYPASPPSGQTGSQPGGQPPGGYPPGYAPPGYAPPGYPPGYAPPGYAPPGYPRGYAPPGYPPGYAPPGYPPGYAPPSYTPPVPAEPTHTGTYVRLQLGGGFTSISGSDGTGGTVKLAGGGPAFAVAVGGSPVPNLAVFGSILFTGPSQPQVSKPGYNDVQSSGDALVGGFGAGIVYYFMPANIFLSGAVCALSFEADDSDGKTTDTSDFGVGFEGTVGKEFWVSEHWGLGAALELVGASSMKDKDNPNLTWSAGAFNLLFTATYF